jgi:hypothetical protein
MILGHFYSLRKELSLFKRIIVAQDYISLQVDMELKRTDARRWIGRLYHKAKVCYPVDWVDIMPDRVNKLRCYTQKWLSLGCPLRSLRCSDALTRHIDL